LKLRFSAYSTTTVLDVLAQQRIERAIGQWMR
jgi:hypothetical protein